MENYKYGLYGEMVDSISTVPEQSSTVAVYVGTAPINLVRGWEDKDLVNYPVELNQGNYQTGLGYSDNWEDFTLGEAIAVHFRNSLVGVGPIICINVLDPAKHKSTTAQTKELTFVNGYARFQSDTIILDSLVLADMVEGTDFEFSYDYETASVIVHAFDDTTDKVNATYNVVDPTMIEASDIIGSVLTTGEATGLEVVSLVYQANEKVTNLLAVPGWSQNKAVYQKMLKVIRKLNGHWDAFAIADIPIASTATKELAIAWKKSNDYVSELSKVCWPKWQATDGTIYHLSTITVWRTMLTDAEHAGIPMETPANKQIMAGKQYFGANSKNRGYDQQACNDITKSGITTACYWGGMDVLWGDHTAAYEFGKVKDRRVIFDNSIRMMMYVSNSFQIDHAFEIDKPMDKARAESIRIREQEKADSLASMGALIGDPVVTFEQTDNPIGNLIEGNFVWRNKMTPTPPFKSGTLKVAYTDEGFQTYYTEGSES